MSGRFRWVAWVIVAWTVIGAFVSAFRVPWTWNANQVFLVLILLCLTPLPVFWGYVWVREGAAGVKTRWANRNSIVAQPLSKRALFWTYVFWIGVGLALVVLFNVVQPH